jgi:hypothetical protein
VTVSVRNSYPYYLLRNLQSWVQWQQRRYEAPSPLFIKRAVLLRNGHPDSTWIETGTYLGETTRFLAKRSQFVHSLEPEPTLFANAKELFKNAGNVRIINGTSETVLPGLLPAISGSVNFWLDGHYSAGITYKGSQDTPIADELSCIARNLAHLNQVCVLIDDVRLFVDNSNENSGYPPLDFLVTWSRENSFRWHIEQDIFVAKRYERIS